MLYVCTYNTACMESTLALRSSPGIHFGIKIAEMMATRRIITIVMMVVLDAVVVAVMGPNNNFME